MVLAGDGKGLHTGEGGEKARVVIQHGGDLGLLQHDFGEPNAVGVARLPRQVVAPVLALPLDKAGGEKIDHTEHRNIFRLPNNKNKAACYLIIELITEIIELLT